MRINGFEQIKGFYSWVFENQDKNVKTSHISLYMFLINQNNRNGWVEWFKCPFDLAMAGSSISNKNTYYKCLNDLHDWGLIVYQKGSNNYKAPLIKVEVLFDTATVPQSEPQLEPLLYRYCTSNATDNVPQLRNNIKLLTNNIKLITNNIKSVIDFLNQKPLEKKEEETGAPTFDEFWDAYDKKVGPKEKIKSKWNKLPRKTKEEIMDYIPRYKAANPDKKYRKNPETFFNQEGWNDEIIVSGPLSKQYLANQQSQTFGHNR
jgi:hypothetical protein